jgi:hypothetical protein
MSRFSAAIANIVSGCGAIGEKCCREDEIALLAARRAKGRPKQLRVGPAETERDYDREQQTSDQGFRSGFQGFRKFKSAYQLAPVRS